MHFVTTVDKVIDDAFKLFFFSLCINKPDEVLPFPLLGVPLRIFPVDCYIDEI